MWSVKIITIINLSVKEMLRFTQPQPGGPEYLLCTVLSPLHYSQTYLSVKPVTLYSYCVSVYSNLQQDICEIHIGTMWSRLCNVFPPPASS